jgi:oligopeptide transport system substrate-binding protein
MVFRVFLAISGLFLLAGADLSAEQVIYRSHGGDPSSLDPHKSINDMDHMVQNDLFEGLVSFDEKGKIIPGVALSWTESSDKLTYTFKLRKEAIWSNGDPVTSHDFVYSFQRLLNPENGLTASFMLSNLKNANLIIKGKIKDLSQLGVKGIDDHTLEIKLETPIPYLLDILASYGAYPLHRKTVETHGNRWSRPGVMVSNGPFVLSEWKDGQYIKLSKNPLYWGKDRVKPEGVCFLSIADESTELKMFRRGEIDISHYNFPSTTLEFMQKKDPSVIRVSPGLRIGMYVFSMRKSAMQDKRIREALNLAVDRTLITEKVLFSGASTPAYGFCIPGLKNKLNNNLKQVDMTREEQCARAQQLYKEAGYSKKNPLVIDLMLPQIPNRRKIGVAVAGMIQQVLGAQVKLDGKEFKVYFQQMGNNIYDMCDLIWSLDYNDILSILEQFSSSHTSVNAAFYSNPQFEALLKQARQASDFSVRDKILNQACQILLDDYVVMPLFFLKDVRLVHPRLEGFHPNTSGRYGSRYMSINPQKAHLTF